MPRTVGLAEFPPPSARWPSPPLKAAENASPGRSRRGRRRTDAAYRLPLDSWRSNDLFCRNSVDGVCQEGFGFWLDQQIPPARRLRGCVIAPPGTRPLFASTHGGRIVTNSRHPLGNWPCAPLTDLRRATSPIGCDECAETVVSAIRFTSRPSLLALWARTAWLDS